MYHFDEKPALVLNSFSARHTTFLVVSFNSQASEMYLIVSYIFAALIANFVSGDIHGGRNEWEIKDTLEGTYHLFCDNLFGNDFSFFFL